MWAPAQGLLCYCGHGEGRLPLTFSGLNRRQYLFTPFLSPWKAEERRDLGGSQETLPGQPQGRRPGRGRQGLLEAVWLRTET